MSIPQRNLRCLWTSPKTSHDSTPLILTCVDTHMLSFVFQSMYEFHQEIAIRRSRTLGPAATWRRVNFHINPDLSVVYTTHSIHKFISLLSGTFLSSAREMIHIDIFNTPLASIDNVCSGIAIHSTIGTVCSGDSKLIAWVFNAFPASDTYELRHVHSQSTKNKGYLRYQSCKDSQEKFSHL